MKNVTFVIDYCPHFFYHIVDIGYQVIILVKN